MLAGVGVGLTAYLAHEKQNALQAELHNQFVHLDFALSNLLHEIEFDVGGLAANKLVRTRADALFTSYLDADPGSFKHNAGQSEQNILELLDDYRLSHPHVISAYIGYANGSFVRSPRPLPASRYDPRSSRWYKLAVQNPGSIVHTAPNPSGKTSDITVGTVTSLAGEQRDLYGVMGVDVTLVDLSRYIQSIRVGEAGYLMLLSDNGAVLANPNGHARYSVAQTYSSAYLDKINAANEGFLETQGISLAGQPEPTYVYFYKSPDLGWVLMAVLSKYEINNEIVLSAARAVAVLGVSLFLIGGLTILRLQRSVVAPLRAVAQRTASIGDTRAWDSKIETDARYEVARLAESINAMLSSIDHVDRAARQNEAELEKRCENLERQLEQTTVELANGEKQLRSVQQTAERREAAQDEVIRSRLAEIEHQVSLDFLADIGRELRTPINSIVGMSYLASQTQLAATQLDCASKMQSHAHELRAIVKDILDFCAVGAGKLESVCNDFNLEEVLRCVRDLVARRPRDRKLYLLFRVDKEVPATLAGDPSRLGRLLASLAKSVSMAACERQVEVAVALVDTAGSRARVQFSVRAARAIAPTGYPGSFLRKSTQADVFAAGSRGEARLCLAIARHLAVVMGGEFHADSQQGLGDRLVYCADFGRLPETH